jgi:hypothetical protein
MFSSFTLFFPNYRYLPDVHQEDQEAVSAIFLPVSASTLAISLCGHSRLSSPLIPYAMMK